LRRRAHGGGEAESKRQPFWDKMAHVKLVPTNAGLGHLGQDPPSFQAALKRDIVVNIDWNNDGEAIRPKIEGP